MKPCVGPLVAGLCFLGFGIAGLVWSAAGAAESLTHLSAGRPVEGRVLGHEPVPSLLGPVPAPVLEIARPDGIWILATRDGARFAAGQRVGALLVETGGAPTVRLPGTVSFWAVPVLGLLLGAGGVALGGIRLRQGVARLRVRAPSASG